jgi:hypothetical protein
MKIRVLSVVAALFLHSPLVLTQGAGQPLTIQGLEHNNLFDVRTRGMGGAGLASGRNATIVFTNPAGLATINALDIRVAGNVVTGSQQQTQEWYPNRLYPGLSLLMEDKWGLIQAPTDTGGNPITDPWEQLQKPFDTMGPNWARKTNRTAPLNIACALPVVIEGVPVVFAAGASRAIDLDNYYQNNNVTDPLLGQYRPAPLHELAQGDTLRARWYQTLWSRKGSVWGVTGGAGVNLTGISVGASGTYYTGKSDDLEQRLDRGYLTFLYNRFRIQDTVKYLGTRTGTSTYSGFKGAISARFDQPRFSVAVSVDLPYTIKRKFSSTFHSREDILVRRTPDSLRTMIVDSIGNGTDRIHFPAAFTVGVQIAPFQKWIFAFDYALRDLSNVNYTPAQGSPGRPWLAAPAFRLGAEYQWQEWIAFRGGYREVPLSYEPEGAAILGDPIVQSVYTAGVGVRVYGVDIDVAYDYGRIDYQDSWQSNVNKNVLNQNSVMLQLGYRLAASAEK